MRVSEIIGILSSVLFAALFITSLAARPPIYAYWGENTKRILSGGLQELGTVLSDYLLGGFFPALTGVIIVVIGIIIGVSMLLREGE
ncbi:MAG: hypothetical protein RQ862_02560 [Candidatus Caldarchaeales archaeon]|jgi:hypothetical protein|nr:hypothetical protein [Candidatus Caldarchaeales archaeon]